MSICVCETSPGIVIVTILNYSNPDYDALVSKNIDQFWILYPKQPYCHNIFKGYMYTFYTEYVDYGPIYSW